MNAFPGIAARRWIKAQAEVHSFDDAKRFLAGEGCKGLASNILAHVVAGTHEHPLSIAIRLYDTDVLIYHSDGTFELDDGGHSTPTTKNRCNRFAPGNWRFRLKDKKLVAIEPGSKK